MKMVEIMNLAYIELLKRYQKEEKQKDGPIKQHRLPILKEKLDHLHNLILIEEKK